MGVSTNYCITDTGTLLLSFQEQQPRRNFVKSYVKDLTKSAIHADQKHVKLQQMWPQIFAELIRNAVMDMWDTQAYMKKCMDDLDKS